VAGLLWTTAHQTLACELSRLPRLYDQTMTDLQGASSDKARLEFLRAGLTRFTAVFDTCETAPTMTFDKLKDAYEMRSLLIGFNELAIDATSSRFTPYSCAVAEGFLRDVGHTHGLPDDPSARVRAARKRLAQWCATGKK
jgi:hypothetical protein